MTVKKPLTLFLFTSILSVKSTCLTFNCCFLSGLARLWDLSDRQDSRLPRRPLLLSHLRLHVLAARLLVEIHERSGVSYFDVINIPRWFENKGGVFKNLLFLIFSFLLTSFLKKKSSGVIFKTANFISPKAPVYIIA